MMPISSKKSPLTNYKMSGRGPAFSKSTMVVSGLVVLIGLTIFPTIIMPRMNPGYYSKQG